MKTWRSRAITSWWKPAIGRFRGGLRLDLSEPRGYIERPFMLFYQRYYERAAGSLHHGYGCFAPFFSLQHGGETSIDLVHMHR